MDRSFSRMPTVFLRFWTNNSAELFGASSGLNATLTMISRAASEMRVLLRKARGTNNGHEFQAKFHWHVEDQGIRHAHIKPSSPQLNCKVERSQRSDEQEFYQLLSYAGDVELNAKLAEWEQFYNLARPLGAHNGKKPYEALREKL